MECIGSAASSEMTSISGGIMNVFVIGRCFDKFLHICLQVFCSNIVRNVEPVAEGKGLDGEGTVSVSWLPQLE